MIRKELVMGREVKLELGFIQALQKFFGARPTEAKTIGWGTTEYRNMVKKRVSEGRLTRWDVPQPIREKVRR